MAWNWLKMRMPLTPRKLSNPRTANPWTIIPQTPATVKIRPCRYLRPLFWWCAHLFLFVQLSYNINGPKYYNERCIFRWSRRLLESKFLRSTTVNCKKAILTMTHQLFIKYMDWTSSLAAPYGSRRICPQSAVNSFRQAEHCQTRHQILSFVSNLSISS